VLGVLPDSAAPLAAAALAARLRAPAWEIALVGGTSLPAQLSAAAARIAVRRTAFAAELGGFLPLGARLQLALGVSVGMVLYGRSTRESAPRLSRTADRTSVSPSLGPLAALCWQLAPQVRLALRAGVAFVPRPTRFAYDDPNDGSARELAAFHWYEPYAGLAFMLDLWQRR
jgi:hypothetical protein